jgi:FAD/FMN-containing dehydrogenase
MFMRMGAAHFQIGRFYPYRDSRHGDTFALLRAVKQHVDPDGLINPGVLGLD